MEENKGIEVQKVDNVDSKNLKPFLGIFIILLIILSGYYFIWRSITFKMKDAIVESLSDFKYDTISVSGFPFSKTVKINNLTFANNIFLASKNSINIKQAKISSLIFGSELDITLKDVMNINSASNTSYSLNYNENPTIKLSLYSDGNLKGFYYSDNGYRVVNEENKTIYTAEKSLIDIKSVKHDNTIDYSTTGDLVGMQNISILEQKNDVSISVVPEVYNMKIDVATSITKKDGEIEKSTIKVNNINFISDKGNGFSANGEIFRDAEDPYSFGEIKLIINNYQNFLNNYKKDVDEALAMEGEASNISKNEKEQYIQMSDRMFAALTNIIAKNPDTKDDKGVLVITRLKNTPDYTVNGESFFGIVQNLILNK